MLTDLLVPRSPTKGARTDAAITALGGEFHRTEGHGSWDMAQEAYCPGHGSPGPRPRLFSWAATVWGMWSEDAGWACGLGGCPCQQRPRGEREQAGARHVLHAIPCVF